MDIGLDHLDELVLAGKPSAVIAFPLQNAPEALHRAVINAVCYAGHTLRHTCLYELVVEGTVGILKPSVAVEEGMRVRIDFYSLIKGLENQRITVIDSFSHKRTACFEIVLLCVHNNLCTARMRLYRLIQMAAVWKNRTREFHSVPKVTQTFAFFICWPNRRRC